MRRIHLLIVCALVIQNTVQGEDKVLYQDEVEALAKEVNGLSVSGTNARSVRQQKSYDDPHNSEPSQIILSTTKEIKPEQIIQPLQYEIAHHGAHTHLTRLDVTCDSSGMRVNLEFDGPYNGIVYSKGHSSNRRCRYVNKDSARGSFNFVIPMDSCGTVGEDRRDDHETILVFQNEESIQEIWDLAKRIRCPTLVRKKITKIVNFSAYSVDKIIIDDPPYVPIQYETKIECWMKILIGDDPCGSNTAQKRVKIGDHMTAVVYVNDGGANYDILVKECFAHDQEDLKGRNTSSVQLSDSAGCHSKEKLLGPFKRSSQTCSSGANFLAYAPISAFKFAERSNVFLTCVVELCPDGCDQCTSGNTPPVIKVCPPPSVMVGDKCEVPRYKGGSSDNHAFHVRKTGRGSRRVYDGSRPTFTPPSRAQGRRKRDASKNIVITGVISEFQYN